MITQEMIDEFIDINLDFETAPTQKDLCEKLNCEFDKITTKIISELQKKCKEELDKIQHRRNIFRRKKYISEKNKDTKTIDKIENPQFKFASFREFYVWFKEQPLVCCYCGVSQDEISIDEKNPLKNTRSPYHRLKRKKRGVSLEIERVVTFKEENGQITFDNNVYNENNCRLACHVCNNAKSDFISVQEFKPIAKGINIFWNKILSQEKKADDNLYFNTYVKFPENSDIWTLK